MENLPQIVRERLRAGAKAEGHPDADLLTAFSESLLNERERAGVLQHLSTCADCRELVALAQPEMAMDQIVAAAAAVAASPAAASPAGAMAAPRKRWSTGFIFGWAALTACLVVSAGWLGYRALQGDKREYAGNAGSQNEQGLTGRNPFATQPPSLEAAPTAPSATDQTMAQVEPSPADMASRKALADRQSRDIEAPGDANRRLRGMMKKKNGPRLAAPKEKGPAMAFAPPPQIPQKTEPVIVTGAATEVAAAPSPQANLPTTGPASGGTSGGSSAGVSPSSPTAAAPPVAASAESVTITDAQAPITPQANSAKDSIAAFSAKSMGTRAVAGRARPAGLARVSGDQITARWTLSSDGSTLMRSTDQGNAWTVMDVGRGAVLRAISALGPDVWVGGRAGALYHSTDMGGHWKPVKPSSGNSTLTEDIVSLNFADAEHGKLTTASGKTWATSDGGKSWQTAN